MTSELDLSQADPNDPVLPHLRTLHRAMSEVDAALRAMDLKGANSVSGPAICTMVAQMTVVNVIENFPLEAVPHFIDSCTKTALAMLEASQGAAPGSVVTLMADQDGLRNVKTERKQ